MTKCKTENVLWILTGLIGDDEINRQHELRHQRSP